MDTAVPNLIWIIGSGAVAAVVALIVGRRRGLDQAEDRADGEIKKLVDAQAARLALQDVEIQSLRAQVRSLTEQVATLRAELDVERRISARFRTDTTADGR